MIAIPKDTTPDVERQANWPGATARFPSLPDGYRVAFVADQPAVNAQIVEESKQGFVLLVDDPSRSIGETAFTRQLVRVTCGNRRLTGFVSGIHSAGAGRLRTAITIASHVDQGRAIWCDDDEIIFRLT